MPRTRQRRRLTDAERRERRRRNHERLAEATRALLESDGWRAWLRTRATLHGYSLHNTLLIALECRRRGFDATYVAGFHAWRKLGRAVRRGEKGIPIFAPMPLRRRDDEDDESSKSPRLLFRVVHVFDVSQTEPLPGADPAPLSPPSAPIDGDSHRHLLRPLETLAAELGYAVEYRHLHGADGACDRRTRVVAVSDKLAPNGRVAVLIHELAHALVGTESGLSPRLEEVVVEAVAYIACAAADLDTGTDSVPYIATYGGDRTIEALEKTAELIDQLARRIETALDPAPVDPAADEGRPA
jgi:N-terminal domain of anti-restriction factor ArdC